MIQDVASRDYGELSSPIGTGFLPENFIPPASIDLPRAYGGDLLLSTINRGKDPSTTPLTQGMLRHCFLAFWLRSVSK